MRRTLVITCFAAILLSVAAGRLAEATEVGYGRNLGLGFELGDPTGFTGKYWIGKTNALDFGVGFDGYYYGGTCFNNNTRVCGGRITMNGDYLWQSSLIKSTAQLDWHIGAGGRLSIANANDGRNYVAIGGRMPVGLDLMFANPNFLELFFELAPVISVVSGGPILGLSFDVDLGVRFYF